MAYKSPDDPSPRAPVRMSTGDPVGKTRAKRDRFALALAQGYGRTQAALLAGSKPRSAQKEGSQMWADPYVQRRFTELRKEIDEEQLVTRTDILLGLLSEARDSDAPGGTQAARVSAWNAIARITGNERPQKMEITHGGVMVVPMIGGGSQDWEQVAAEQQQVLRDAVRK